MSNAAPNGNTELLITLAKALHQVGFSSHSIEHRLLAVARRIGSQAEVFSLPSGSLLTVLHDGTPSTYVLRARPAGVNLERMAQLIRTTDAVIAGKLAPHQAKSEIDDLMRAPERWGGFATIVAYLFSGGAFAVFFGGAANEVFVAALVGLVAGILAALMRRWRITTRLFELLAAAAAAFLVEFVSPHIGPVVDWIPLAAGLIILLPGISLLDSLTELSHGQLVSGGARLAGVGVAFLALAFGAIAGYSLAELLPHSISAYSPQEIGAGWTPLALIFVAIGSMIRFRARPHDLLVILLASALAFYVTRWETEHMAGLAGPFLAAFLLGIAGNLFAKFARNAQELVVIPGIALLVPGSVGVLSLSAILARNTFGGIEAGIQMFLIAMALTAGILFSQSLVRDNGSTERAAAN